MPAPRAWAKARVWGFSFAREPLRVTVLTILLLLPLLWLQRSRMETLKMNRLEECGPFCALPKPNFVWIQHVQRAAGTWLCATALDNLGGDFDLAAEDDYTCEPFVNGARLTAYSSLDNAALIQLGLKYKVLASQWESFDPRFFEMRSRGAAFVAVVREPFERLCSWMHYARPKYTLSNLTGFIERRLDNPMVRMFAKSAVTARNVTEEHLIEAQNVLSQFDKVILQEDLARGHFGPNVWGWSFNLSDRVNERPNMDSVGVPSCRSRMSVVDQSRVDARLVWDQRFFKFAQALVATRDVCCGVVGKLFKT